MSILTNINSLLPPLRTLNQMQRPVGMERSPVQQRSTAGTDHIDRLTLTIESTFEACATTVHVAGPINHDTYQDLLACATVLYEDGTRQLTLDLAGCQQIQLSGLFALHSIVTLYRGATPLDPETGLRGLCQMARRNQEAGMCPGVRCIKAQPKIADMLAKNGFMQEAAVA